MFVLAQTRPRFVLLKPQMCSLGFGLALFQRKMLIHTSTKMTLRPWKPATLMRWPPVACGRIQNCDTSDNKFAPLSSLF